MTNIERMAKEAGFSEIDVMTINGRAIDRRFTKFAALVVEDCAKLAESAELHWAGGFKIADAIRAKYPMPKEPG